MKVLSVVGARPQFVKLGPLSRALRKHHNEIIIHTGQHYDHEMSDLLFEQLEIPKPDVNLSIGSGSHGVQTGRMLADIESEILRQQPDLVISFGDANSTLAACLAAAKLATPSLHIEAGLRSFNRSMPEEINRIVADHTADLLFAPTQTAVTNLKREGLKDKTVLTGDIMADSIRFIQDKLEQPTNVPDSYFLLTLHRPYNVDDPEKLGNIIRSLGNLDTPVIFPIHPRTLSVLHKNHISVPDKIKLSTPQGYVEFHRLLKFADKVITDSGGLQKEAYIAQKPCLTLRPETEWLETVEAGWNRLLDADDVHLAEKIADFAPGGNHPDLYGENVAIEMVRQIEKWFLR